MIAKLAGMPSYALTHPDDVLLAPLDGMAALYHRSSGQTHLVAEPVPELLAVLTTQPISLAALLARLASDYDLEADDDACIVLAERLDELAALGLIRKVTDA
jgi:PqqD family protein of HPr-rel-A system